MSKSTDFYDAIIRRDTDLDRVAAGYEAEADEQNQLLLAAILLILYKWNPLEVDRPASRRIRIARIADEIRRATADRYRGRFGLGAAEVRRITYAERKWVEGKIREIGGRARAVPAIRAFRDTIVDGQTLDEIWARASQYVAANTTQIVRRTLRGGDVAPGTDVGPIVQEIRKFFAGPVRRLSRTAIPTTISAMTENVREAAYDANLGQIGSFVWTAIRDKATCPRCAAMDGKRWKTDSHGPIGHDTPFITPPIHLRDRCSLSPVFLGDEPPPAETFQEWLEEQPVAVQKSVLGKSRYELFAAGRVRNLDELVDQTGRQITIAELEAKS